MKVWLMAVFLAQSVVFGQGIEWKTWKEASELAKSSHKMIMVEAVRDGCHYCEDMQRDVFENAPMAQMIQRRFIPVKINLSRQAMPLGIEVGMTPTFYFITPEMKVRKAVPGSWNREDFTTILGEIR